MYILKSCSLVRVLAMPHPLCTRTFSVVRMWPRVCTLCIFPSNYMEWYSPPLAPWIIDNIILFGRKDAQWLELELELKLNNVNCQSCTLWHTAKFWCCIIKRAQDTKVIHKQGFSNVQYNWPFFGSIKFILSTTRQGDRGRNGPCTSQCKGLSKGV